MDEQTTAAAVSAWCKEVDSTCQDRPAEALELVRAARSTTIIEAKQLGGYPWRAVSDAVLRVFAKNLEHDAALAFIAEHHPSERFEKLLWCIGMLFDRALELNRPEPAKSALNLFRSEAVRSGLAPYQCAAFDEQYKYLEHHLHLAVGDYAAAAAYLERAGPTSADVQTQLARVALLMGDQARAVSALQTAYRLDPSVRQQVERASPEPLLSFARSEAYRAAFPDPLPSEAVLRRAYQLARESPFEAYVLVRDGLEALSDRLDGLALQVFCLSRICDDLDEHGAANLSHYGSTLSVDDFFRLRDEASSAFTQAQLDTGVRRIPCFEFFKWKPRDTEQSRT